MRGFFSWLLPLLLCAPLTAVAQEQPRPPEGPPPPAAVREPIAPAAPVAPEAREVLRTCRDPIFIDCFREWRPGMEERRRRPPPARQQPQPQPPSANDGVSDGKPDDKKAGDKKEDEKKTDEQKAADKIAADKKATEAKAAADKKAAEARKAAESKPAESKPAAPKPVGPRQPGPDPDLPIYEALMRSIREQGLQDRVRLDGPPKDGAVNLEIAPPKGGYPAPATSGPTIRGRNVLTAPITDDER